MTVQSTVDDAGACGASASWLCGVISLLADGELLFVRYPWVGFAVVSALGGFVGWCVMLERGRFNGQSNWYPTQRLLVRVVLGASVGIGSALIWHAFEGESRGLPMLMSALIAVFPIEAYRGGLKRFRTIILEVFK